MAKECAVLVCRGRVLLAVGGSVSRADVEEELREHVARAAAHEVTDCDAAIVTFDPTRHEDPYRKVIPC